MSAENERSPRLRNWHLRSLHDRVIARCYQETIIRIPRKQDIEIWSYTYKIIYLLLQLMLVQKSEFRK